MTILDSIADKLGFQRKIQELQPIKNSALPPQFEKSEKESLAVDPYTNTLSALVNQPGLRRGSNITLQTLRRMSRANWVDRACINTLRDEITGIPWDIVPVDPKKPYSETFQKYLIKLLKKPNSNNENWRTFIDKVLEDILAVDSGVIEKTRDNKGRIIELFAVDGTSIKPLYDKYGIVGDIAYQQFIPNKKEAVAEWNNDDMIYLMWNPQSGIDMFGLGCSPVEAGIACGTAFLLGEAYNMKWFSGNTIPQMIINMGKDVQPAQVDAFRTFLLAEMQGLEGAHTPIVGSFGEDFKTVELLKNPQEMAWQDYLKWQMQWKVALYRMSPQDIGFGLDQYKVEGEVQQTLSKNKAVNSLKGILKEYIDAEIIGDKGWDIPFEDANMQFKWIDTLSVNPKDQAAVDQIYLNTGVLSINEVRAEQGKDPIKGGQTPRIVLGMSEIQIDPTPLESEGEVNKSIEKSSLMVAKSTTEGVIYPLHINPSAVCWVDDRGCTQPLFVTNFEHTQGFTIKPDFLDQKKGIEPPEQIVAENLRKIKINTPEVLILTQDQVMKLLPVHLYPSFHAWLNIEPPFNSQQWRTRWGKQTRQSEKYIVTGFISGKDLTNQDQLDDMAKNTELYKDALMDLARIWLAEKQFKLGDRKPGHYIITNDKRAFGVDYTFENDDNSWKKTSGRLPLCLQETSQDLYDAFKNCLSEAFDQTEIIKKSITSHGKKKIRGWVPIKGIEEVEKDLAERYQRGIYQWYINAVHIESQKKRLKKSVEFDLEEDYICDGQYVYQNGIKYPLSVLDKDKRPSENNLIVPVLAFSVAYGLGLMAAKKDIIQYAPTDKKITTPTMDTEIQAKRIEQVATSMNQSMINDVSATVDRGIINGKTYIQIAQSIRDTLAINADDPNYPGWRAMRTAKTEAQWSENEGVRQQLKEIGVTQVNILNSDGACDDCIAIAEDGPYTIDEAQGLIPLHPNCACDIVGDYSEFEA